MGVCIRRALVRALCGQTLVPSIGPPVKARAECRSLPSYCMGSTFATGMIGRHMPANEIP